MKGFHKKSFFSQLMASLILDLPSHCFAPLPRSLQLANTICFSKSHLQELKGWASKMLQREFAGKKLQRRNGKFYDRKERSVV